MLRVAAQLLIKYAIVKLLKKDSAGAARDNLLVQFLTANITKHYFIEYTANLYSAQCSRGVTKVKMQNSHFWLICIICNPFDLK